MASGKVQDIKRAFAIFDRNNDGSISIEEIRKVLLEADINFTDEQLKDFMKKLDSDGDGTVDYDEFCHVMADVITGALDTEHRIKEAFHIIDTDGNGRISQSELQKAVRDFGEEITQEEVEEVINIIDKDGDKEINYDEFVTLMYLLNLVA